MTITGDWAEGDPLTPTNLSAKGGGNFPDRTYNAGWKRFGAASVAKEVRIQAAINQAAADSIPAVYVPASMLPYDASAVTFNTGVHMYREGGPTDSSTWDVAAYGAIYPLGDLQPGIQAAIDAAVANDFFGFHRVLLSPNGYTILPIGKPLWTKGHGIQLIAGSDNMNTGQGVALYPTYYGGPAILNMAASATFPGLVSSLATGPGNAWRPTGNAGSSGAYLNLRDSATCDLNGLAAFTIETFLQIENAGDKPYISTSAGRLALSDAGASAYQWIVAFDDQIQIGITTSSGASPFIRGGGALSPNTTYHAAVSYDSTTLRLFLDGVLVASTAWTGTLAQSPIEEVYCGSGTSGSCGIEQSVNQAVSAFKMDGFRISNVCRYTTNFPKPTAKFTNDANTLMLLNFDLQYAQCTRGQTKNGDVWLWCRRQGSSVDPSIGVEYSGFTVTGAGYTQLGIVANPGSNSLRFHNMRFTGRCGVMLLHGDSYFWEAENIRVEAATSAARYGFLATGNAFGTMRNFVAETAGTIGICMGGHLDTGYILASASTVASCYVLNTVNPTGAPSEIVQFSLSSEIGVGANWRGPLLVSTQPNCRASGVIMRSCSIQSRNSECVVIDYADTAVFDGCTFNVFSGSPASIIKVLSGMPLRSIDVTHSIQTSNFLPWSNVPGTVTVGKIGKLTAIAFATPLTLDCSLRDDFELAALTGAITINFSNVTPGQKISLWTVQNAGGGNAITFGTVNGTGSVKGATANDTTGNHYSQYLFDCNLNGNMTQIGFSSGA